MGVFYVGFTQGDSFWGIHPAWFYPSDRAVQMVSHVATHRFENFSLMRELAINYNE